MDEDASFRASTWVTPFEYSFAERRAILDALPLIVAAVGVVEAISDLAPTGLPARRVEHLALLATQLGNRSSNPRETLPPG